MVVFKASRHHPRPVAKHSQLIEQSVLGKPVTGVGEPQEYLLFREPEEISGMNPSLLESSPAKNLQSSKLVRKSPRVKKA